ncbi:MAG TPA: hypothetical protein VKF41_01650 [Bryobacteraceae bacterium]|nr:hypothetical protein [Bryobacteraceae bacterium]
MTAPAEWFRRRRLRESEWSGELDSHLAMREERNRAQRLPAEDARLAARRRFG